MPSEFLCCCHVKTWSWFLLVVQVMLAFCVIVFLTTFLVLKAPDSDLPKQYIASLYVQLLIFAIWLVLAYCLGHALSKYKPMAMRPHLVWTLILTITVVCHLIFMVRRNVMVLAELFAVLAILMVFMLVAEYRCYKWLLYYQHLHYFVMH